MAGTAVIAVEGVLSKDTGDPLISSQPQPTGVMLYHSLKHRFKIALVSRAAREEADHWCQVNGLRDHAYLLGGEEGLQPWKANSSLRASQVKRLRATGLDVELFVDQSPLAVKEVMLEGLACVLFTSPQYSRPEFRPDTERGVRAWGEIEAEIEAEVKRRKSDPRKDADTGRFD